MKECYYNQLTCNSVSFVKSEPGLNKVSALTRFVAFCVANPIVSLI